MTIQPELVRSIAYILEKSDAGEYNGITPDEGDEMAEAILNKFLVVSKMDLPEAKHVDSIIYAGSQAISTYSAPEDILEKALSYLSAASKLTAIQEELKAAKEKEENELLQIINSLISDPKNRANEFSGLTAAEKAAAREIKKLRERVAKLPLAG